MIPTADVFWIVSKDSDVHAAFTRYGARALATRLGVSPQTVYNWLDGSRIPDTTFARACEVVGMSPPMLTMWDKARNDGAVMREFKWTGGIIKKRPGRPRKVAPVA
jgi:hypothetical protein